MAGNESGRPLPTTKPDERSSVAIKDDDFIKAIRACQVIEIAILLSTFWILLCALIYGCKTKKWRKKPGSNSLDQGIMYSCCVGAIALTLPRVIFTAVTLFMNPDILSPMCEAIMDVLNVLYAIASYPVYLYLWLRHRAIYSHPSAHNLNGKCVSLIGWAVVVIIVGLSIVLVWAYIAPDRFKGTATGCAFDSENNDRGTLLIALSGIDIVGQISNLALFIYPMVRCELDQMKNRSCNSRSGILNRREKIQRASMMWRIILCGARDSEQTSSLARTIRRSAYATLMAMTTDTTVTLVAFFGITSTNPLAITATLYDAGILINSLGILSTFGKNRKILSVFWSWPTDDLHEIRTQEPAQRNVVETPT